jgi:hypothetical protein
MEWNLEDKLIKMESVPGSYLDHIATYIRNKDFKIANAKQLSTYIARNAKVAKELEGFTSKQVMSVMDKLETEYKERERLLKLGKRTDNWKWTLETCLKELMK